MEKIIKSAEESLDTALEYYQHQGTPLGYHPTLQYFDGKCPPSPDAMLVIREEVGFIDKYIDFFSQNLFKIIWKDAYNLEITDEAIEEVMKIQKNRIGKILIPEEFKKAGADILIFKPYNDIQKQKDRDELMAHDVWHLIEKERGVLKQYPFIVEGTATYAMKRFRGKRCDTPLENFEEFIMIMYLGSANVVQNYVENTENPYKSILEESLRVKIQEDLLKRVKPVLAKGLEKTLKENQEGMAYTISQIPEFQQLKGKLTEEGIIEAYRKMGANKLAKELQNKNLERLVYWFRIAGF